ncbi:MAG: CCA tRNA nucleotidyltransferase [Enterococcus sp.]
MRLTNLPAEYEKALPVIKKLEQAGFEAYFVGGSVRDSLLGKAIHDVDIATSAFPEEIKNIFPRTIDVGIEHGTVLVLAQEDQYEITTFRTESTYQDFRRPDHVEFVRSLEEDLKRRDFTINAFALKEDGNIIDLFDGLSDLESKLLRAVGNPHERFHEDALRMMRGLRFVSQLGFELEEETFQAIVDNHALLGKISVERINSEFVQLLLGPNRNEGIREFVATECYQYCPGLKEEGEGLLRFADLPTIPIQDESQAWTLLFYHLTLSDTQIRPFLKAWKCSNQLIKEVQALVTGLHERLTTGTLSKWSLYQLGEERALKVEEMSEFFDQLIDLENIRIRYQELPIKSLSELAVNGTILLNEIQKKPGKWVSDLLFVCEQSVIEGDLVNEQESLIRFAKTKLDEDE